MDSKFVLQGKRVWVAGHKGMVGSSIVRRLEREGCDILTVTRQECNLEDYRAVSSWLEANKPDAVFMAAAKVGGILANNTNPVDFLYNNLALQNAVIKASYEQQVEKLMFLGSSCIYPKMAEQPIEEGALLTGPLEPTNEAYAIAKIAGIKLCQAYMRQYGACFISVMPTNLYGPYDNFDLQTSHVIPALMRKAHQAKIAGESGMEIWGTGTPLREFLHVDDLADACVYVMQHYDDHEHINIGSGSDLSIADVARTVMQVVGQEGELRHDLSKPDGTPRKLMSATKLLDLGWRPSIGLEEGLTSTYQWFLENVVE
jgi:GDP-L-fucose synthase